jgi:hypothetical protein
MPPPRACDLAANALAITPANIKNAGVEPAF